MVARRQDDGCFLKDRPLMESREQLALQRQLFEPGRFLKAARRHDVVQHQVDTGRRLRIETPLAHVAIDIAAGQGVVAGVLRLVEQGLHVVRARRQGREPVGKAVSPVVDDARQAGLEVDHVEGEERLGFEPIGAQSRLARRIARTKDEEPAAQRLLDGALVERDVHRHRLGGRCGKTKRHKDGKGHDDKRARRHELPTMVLSEHPCASS